MAAPNRANITVKLSQFGETPDRIPFAFSRALPSPVNPSARQPETPRVREDFDAPITRHPVS